MSQAEADDTPEVKRSSKLPIILGIVLALFGGAGGFYATWSGLILGGESQASGEAENVDALPDIAFVPVEPITVSLGQNAPSDHLRFRAELEVPARYKEDVELILPRVVDVLNSYLRALDVNDLMQASALVRLRAQMLRRVQIVTGPERVNDLLVMEFVLN